MDNKNTGNNGIGFTGLLSIAFIILKLCHVIDWPWKWVLSPIWISAIIAAVTFIIIVIAEKW